MTGYRLGVIEALAWFWGAGVVLACWEHGGHRSLGESTGVLGVTTEALNS